MSKPPHFFIGLDLATGRLDVESLVIDGATVATVEIKPDIAFTFRGPDGPMQISIATITPVLEQVSELLEEADNEVRALKARIRELESRAKTDDHLGAKMLIDLFAPLQDLDAAMLAAANLVEWVSRTQASKSWLDDPEPLPRIVHEFRGCWMLVLDENKYLREDLGRAGGARDES